MWEEDAGETRLDYMSICGEDDEDDRFPDSYRDRLLSLEAASCKLQSLPSLQLLESKLGIHAAHTYREALEVMEAAEEVTGLVLGFDDEYCSSTWQHREQYQDAADLVSVMSQAAGDQDLLIDSYEAWKVRLRERKRRMNAALREKNRDAYERAHSLGLWLPHGRERDRWREDPRAGPPFLSLVHLVREKLRGEKNVLQYVPRSRYGERSVRKILENGERMVAYLQDL